MCELIVVGPHELTTIARLDSLSTKIIDLMAYDKSYEFTLHSFIECRTHLLKQRNIIRIGMIVNTPEYQTR